METKSKFKFYVGANNLTGEIELKKLCNVLNHYIELSGYTIYPNILGAWRDDGIIKNEKSIIVEIIADLPVQLLEAVKNHICLDLQQESVLCTTEKIVVYIAFRGLPVERSKAFNPRYMCVITLPREITTM